MLVVSDKIHEPSLRIKLKTTVKNTFSDVAA